MSGTQSALFGGGSRWITNPKHMQVISAVQSNLSIKTAAATLNNLGAAAGFTALALRGAQVSIATADTYVTVANLTGAGFMVNCVSPTHTAAFRPTMRITVDGVQYVISPSADQSANYRLVLGPVTGIPSVSTIAAIGTDVIAPNSAVDPGFNTAQVGGVVPMASALGVITPEMALSYGLPVLRFETSLLVEMKASLLSANAVDKQCGVTYRMDL